MRVRFPTVVKKSRKSQSEPRRRLLRDIGDAVFVLNTLVVGLDAVEKGHKKPETLNISWQPKDRKAAARSSRRFVVESVLVRVSSAVAEFVLALSKLPRFQALQESWNADTKLATRVSSISSMLLEKSDYLIPCVALLVHWRNHIVHSTSKAEITTAQRQTLINNKDLIAEHYSGLNVSRLLEHFERGRPTLKDVSSLISMTINFARKTDRAMHKNLTKDELDAWMAHYELNPVLEKIKAESSPRKVEESVRRMFKTQAPYLLDAYVQHYGSDA